MIVSGGAPLSPDTHEFIRICLCNTVVQGYGLTETCAAAVVMDSKSYNFRVFSVIVEWNRNYILNQQLYYCLVNDMTMGRAGSPLTVCDVRLTDWDEGNYKVTDKPYPRGEILIGAYYLYLKSFYQLVLVV